MRSLLSLLVFSVCIAIAQARPEQAQRDLTSNNSGAAVSKVDPALEKDYERLQAEDDAVQAEIEKWKSEHARLKAEGKAPPDEQLEKRIQERQQTVRKAYERFLEHYPNFAQAHLTYGSFLSQLEQDNAAQAQWEKALQLDPKLAVAYNNLAGIYTERGDTRKASEFFNKAIQISPTDGSFYHNFGDSVYVLRKAIMAQEGLTEQQVYAKALGLYSNAFRLAPTNYQFASDLAQTYYALTPLPFETALSAWTNAMAVATDENQRQLTSIHLARLKMLSGRLTEARAHLATVTLPECAQLKSNLLARIVERENAPKPQPAPAEGTKKD